MFSDYIENFITHVTSGLACSHGMTTNTCKDCLENEAISLLARCQIRREKLYGNVIVQWGERHNMIVAAEEAAELIAALQRYQRDMDSRTDDITKAIAEVKVIEELADTIIVTEQLRLVFGLLRVDAEVNKKLKRLEALIATQEDR